MGKNPYTVTRSTDFSTFEFVSTSTQREIKKRIEYDITDQTFDGKYIYNLAFGDIMEDNDIDDKAESNNGDFISIMSTIIASLYEYTAQYPERPVYFKGSNGQRTDVYNMLVRRKYREMRNNFNIYGVVELEEYQEIEEFEPEKEYHGFLVIRKLNEN